MQQQRIGLSSERARRLSTTPPSQSLWSARIVSIQPRSPDPHTAAAVAGVLPPPRKLTFTPRSCQSDELRRQVSRSASCAGARERRYCKARLKKVPPKLPHRPSGRSAAAPVRMRIPARRRRMLREPKRRASAARTVSASGCCARRLLPRRSRWERSKQAG